MEIDHADGELRARADALKRAAAALGEIVSVAMESPVHRRMTLADLEWLAMPALVNEQVLIIHAPARPGRPSVPSAVLMWASVSAEVDARLAAERDVPARLGLKERTSGDQLWITDAIGDSSLLNAGLDNLLKSTFKGRTVKLVVPDASGQPKVVERGG
jgi:hemolysin-activating ACP:hemolysin acyltransferase